MLAIVLSPFHVVKNFIPTKSFEVVITSILYRCRNWDTEQLRNLSEVPEPVSGRTGINQAVWLRQVLLATMLILRACFCPLGGKVFDNYV